MTPEERKELADLGYKLDEMLAHPDYDACEEMYRKISTQKDKDIKGYFKLWD